LVGSSREQEVGGSEQQPAQRHAAALAAAQARDVGGRQAQRAHLNLRCLFRSGTA
jgi:hypothetical protein